MLAELALWRYMRFMISVGFARVVGVLLSAATFPYLLRKLGVEVFGIWSYVAAIQGFVEIIANPGIMAFAQQQVSARRKEAAPILADVLTLRCIAALLAAGVVVVVALFEPKPEVRWVMFAYGIGSVLLSPWASDYLLNAMECFHEASLQTVLTQALYAAMIFTLVKEHRDIVWLVIATLVSVAAGNVFGWWRLWREGLRPGLSLHPERWRGILVPSVHYMLASIMSMTCCRIMHIVIRWRLGEYALGLFAAATRAVEVVYSLINILYVLIQPRIAFRAAQGLPLVRTLRLGVSVFALVSFPLTIGGIIAAPTLIPWVLGSAFRESVPLFQWSAPYFVTASAATFFTGGVIYSLGHHRAYLGSTACGAAIASLLCVILIPAMGLVGACVAFVAGALGVGMCAYFLCPPEATESIKAPLMGVAVIASAIMAAALAFVPAMRVHPLILVGIGAGVYILSCFVLGGYWIRRELRGLV